MLSPMVSPGGHLGLMSHTPRSGMPSPNISLGVHERVCAYVCGCVYDRAGGCMWVWVILYAYVCMRCVRVCACNCVSSWGIYSAAVLFRYAST